MEKRTMKTTGEQVSLLGLGCMRFPNKTPGTEDIDYEKAEKMVDYAYAHGVNYYDTAYVYHGQDSERFLGQALKKYPRESYYVADKLPMWFLNSEDDIDRIFFEHLERLQMDYIDFYLCHAMDAGRLEILKKLNVVSHLEKFKREGKIRHIGFSFHDTPDVLKNILDTYDGWEFVQLQLNYQDWDFQDAKAQYELVESYGVPCIVMEPVRGGGLADLGEAANAVFKKAAPDQSVASWGIRYAASKPNVLTVLSGMSNDEQLADNVDTVTNFKPIDAQGQKVIDEALDVFRKNVLIPCTACRYCSDCPVGIDIPAIFKLHNAYTMKQHHKDEFMDGYLKIEEQNRADQCVSCRQCQSHCPQSLEIPELLQKIAAFAAE